MSKKITLDELNALISNNRDHRNSGKWERWEDDTIRFTPGTLTLWEKPEDYAGEYFFGWYTVISRHRNSGLLTNSNYETVLAYLNAVDEYINELGEQWGPALDSEICKDEDGMEVHWWLDARFSHWAVGWVEGILINQFAHLHLAVADALMARHDDYPVLDDDDYEERQEEQQLSAWDDWAYLDYKDEIEEWLGVDLSPVENMGSAFVELVYQMGLYWSDTDSEGVIIDGDFSQQIAHIQKEVRLGSPGEMEREDECRELLLNAGAVLVESEDEEDMEDE